MKVLYFCPDLPGERASGGAQAHRYFIDEFYKIFGKNLTVIGISSLKNFVDYPPHIRPVQLDKKNFLTLFIDQVRAFSYPFKIVSRSSKKGCIIVNEALESMQYDVIVIDHFDSLSLISISELKKIKKPIVYISHNIESKLLFDISNLHPRYKIKHWLAKLDLYKIKKMEDELLKLSSTVIFLSEDDLLDANKQGNQKFYSHVPAVLKEIDVNHSTQRGTKKILFSINYKFRPNLHALEWLISSFSSELTKIKSEVKIIVTGLPAGALPKTTSSNVEYKAFLPTTEFLGLYKQVDLFICPIKYGSGVKMKIVEALQNNVPVLAFAESWRGLSNVCKGGVLPEEPSEAAFFVDEIIKNEMRLEEISVDQTHCFNELIMSQTQIIDIIKNL